MRGGLLCLALAGGALAAPKVMVKAEQLPVVSRVVAIERPTPFSQVRVELDAAGRFYVNGGRMTLHEVGAFVLRATEERATYLRRQGKAGYDKLPSGIKGSNVSVYLRVHREAPWRHVQWLLAVLAEQRAFKTEFMARDQKGREGVVKVWLPFDAAMEGGFQFPEDDADETAKAPKKKRHTLTLTLLAEGRRPIRFAGRPAEGPAAIAWAVGKRKTKKRATFEQWLGDALRGKKTVEIRAHGKVAYGEVLAVVDFVRSRGHERIDLYRAEIPTRAERARKQLPYPK